MKLLNFHKKFPEDYFDSMNSGAGGIGPVFHINDGVEKYQSDAFCSFEYHKENYENRVLAAEPIEDRAG